MLGTTLPCDRVKAILASVQQSDLIVVGDTMIDEYFWGDVQRISPEAPVPVVEVESVSRSLGGAANVVQNLSRLGTKARLISVCGDDDNGILLGKMLNDICPSDTLFKSASRPTTIKTRIIARHQQVVRADREIIRDLDEMELAALMGYFNGLIGSSDGVIISDYGKGVVSPSLINHIIKRCKADGKFIAVDPKDRHIQYYTGASVITPNLREAHVLAGISYHNCSDEEIEKLGWMIINKYDLQYLLITLSERGMALFCREGKTFLHLPTVAQKVFDVTGAGDTVISIFTAAISGNASPAEAAFLANHAAGITVAQLGTVSVSPDELLASCSSET